MKNKSIFLFFLLALLFVNGFTQPGVLPIKSGNSTLFGQDVVINEHAAQNQRNITICSAYNGWLYAAYSYYDPAALQDAVTILRSKDNGTTWSVFLDGNSGLYHSSIAGLDMIACGHDSANIKVFVSFCIFDTITSNQFILVVRYNGNTGVAEGELLHENSVSVRDLAFASDNQYPATNSNPFSIALVYTKQFITDSVVFCSSSDGGLTFDQHHSIATSPHYLGKVSLSYGRSPAFNTGRYFAAWEEKDNANAVTGHIYTAHSEPNFNSPFTTPLQIDSIEASSFNKVRNPTIVCQQNETDNDSLNLTEVVLFEKYIPSENRYGIGGFYNMKSTNTNHFKQFTVTSSSDNLQMPSITFDPYNSKFLVTYYDSTTQKLPFLVNNFNLTTPDNWQIMNVGYNESNSLDNPFPKIAVNFGLNQAIMAWSKKGAGDNGVALFDAPYNNWLSFPEEIKTGNLRNLIVHPNPSRLNATMTFDLNKTELVTISLFNIDGRYIKTIANQQFETGMHQFKFDVSALPPNIYFYTFKSSDISTCGKIVVIR